MKTMVSDFGLKCLGYGSRLLWFGTVSLGKTLHLYVHSLDPGVNGYLAGQWLLVCWYSCQCHDGSRAVCSPGSGVGTGTNRSYNQGKLMWRAQKSYIMLHYISTPNTMPYNTVKLPEVVWQTYNAQVVNNLEDHSGPLAFDAFFTKCIKLLALLHAAPGPTSWCALYNNYLSS